MSKPEMSASNKLLCLAFIYLGTIFLILGARSILVRIIPKPPVICKICHCGKELCAASCGEESMCLLRCERDCHGRKP
jgi:hypothetical protein